MRTLRLFGRQFSSPLVLLLVFAALLSTSLGDRENALVLFAILLLMGTVGFWQEYRADRAVQQLRALLHTTCTVQRGAHTRKIPITQVVPGDVVLLTAGDLVPGDCLLLAATDLHVNESALTGESFPVEKEVGLTPEDAPLTERRNALFEGSSVMSGAGKVVVVNTGADTEFGRISASMEKIAPQTAFQAGIHRFGNMLLRMTLLLSGGILIFNLFFGKPIADSILFSIALAVGLAPELLPAIMVTTLSAGASRLAREQVIVKKLDAIQNLGSMNILCSDKTGTLTTGEALVAATTGVDGQPSVRVRLFAFLNAFFETGFVNPIDAAIRRIPDVDIGNFVKKDEVPYDFERKRLSIVVHSDGGDWMITKGALTNVLEVCRQVEMPDGRIVELPAVQEEIRRYYETQSAQGYRLIGIAWKDVSGDPVIDKSDEADMVFLGFILLEDPAKVGIADTVRHLESLGITLKIITGDNRLAAAHLAQSIGIPHDPILTGPEISRIDEPALARRAEGVGLFAEVEPQQKERLIRALRSQGHVVGYLGDGINDAPALKAADVGISVDAAVDVAKEAADIVLMQKDLEVLRKGVLDGRKTYLNTLKYIFITTSANFGNMFSLAGISVFLPWLPLLPSQILTLNFLSDIPALTIASDRVDEEGLAQPKRWDIGLIRRFMIVFGLQSALFDYLTFAVLLLGFKAGEQMFQTGWFLESVMTEIAVLLLIRTTRPVFQSRPSGWLVLTSGLTLVVTLLLPYSPLATAIGLHPLPPFLFGGVIGIALLYALMVETTKKRFFART